MKTQYASGRNSLPAPLITTSTGGTIQGDNQTYYFWIKARNRVGYNQPSIVRNLVIPNNSRITIPASTFTTFAYEDWFEFVISVSTSNNYFSSRIIYKQRLFEEDQVTSIAVSSITFSDNWIINGVTEVPTEASFPNNAPYGYRLKHLGTGNVYEYLPDSDLVANNITVFNANNAVGRWVQTTSNSLTEPFSYATKEVIEVTQEEFLAAPIEASLGDSVEIKYYILNDSGQAITDRELRLNEYLSDISISLTFDVTVYGYLNTVTNVLDTTGIENVNSTVTFPETRPRLSKALPNNSAYVVGIRPNINPIADIVPGSLISLYPLLSRFSIITGVEDWAEPVETISALKSLNPVQIKDMQIRLIRSIRKAFYYDASSTLSDNGSTVLIPNSLPVSGRWLTLEQAILPGSVDTEHLSEDVLELFSNQIRTVNETITIPGNYTINLDTQTQDYFILNCPAVDINNTPTVINITGTLENNECRAIGLELRQGTGLVSLHNSFLFPGGQLPVFSGNGKTDLVIIKLLRDNSGTLKKRAFLVQSDIG